MICVIRRFALTVSDVCLKLGCFQSTYSALDVNIALYALYKSRLTGAYLLNVYVGFVNVGLCLLSNVTRAVN